MRERKAAIVYQHKIIRFALEAGYQYVVFTNNDVILPSCTTSVLQSLLPVTPMLLPLTTARGVGHNPAQVKYMISLVLNIA